MQNIADFPIPLPQEELEKGYKRMRLMGRFAWFILGILTLVTSTGCVRDPNVRKQRYVESGRKYFQQKKYPEAAIEFQNAIQLDKSFAAAHYELAQCFLQQALWTNAYRELSSAVVLDPANWQAQLDLANLLFGARQFAEAKARALFVLNSNPANLRAQLLLASSDAELGNRQEAIQDAEQAVQIAPDRPSPYLALGLLQEQAGQLTLAEQNLQKAVSLDPKFLPARMAFAGFYQRQKKWEDAEAQYNAAIEANRSSPGPRASLASLYLAWGKGEQAEQTLQAAKRDLPSDSAGYRILGDFYLANGETAMALAEFASLTQEHPQDLNVKKHYIQLLIQDRQLDKALVVDGEILKRNSKDAEALVLKGQALNLQQKPGEAVTALETAVRNNPDDPMGHFQLGISYAMTSNLPGAEREWREAARLRPSMLEAQRSLAKLAFQRGDMELLEQCASQLLKAAPASPEALLLRGTALLGKGDLAGAERDLKKAIAIDPKNAGAYTRFGVLRMSQGRLAEAEKLFEQALENDPRAGEALQRLASVYVAQKQGERAVRRVQAQIAKVPDSSGYYSLLGQALLETHKPTEAQAALSKSVDLDKTNIQAFFLLAQSQVSGGQIDAAVSTYERTIRQNPKDIRAYVAFGTLEESRGNWQGAQKLYQDALQIQPDQPAAANNLSYLLLEHGGNTDHALALAQIARRAMPDSPNTADTLAWAYYKKGIYNSAIDLLEEVTKKVPQNPTYYYHLGLAYEKSNKVEQARSTFQRALQIDPKSPHADEIHQALADLSTDQ